MPALKNLALIAILAAAVGTSVASAQVTATDVDVIPLPPTDPTPNFNSTEAPLNLTTVDVNATDSNSSAETTMPVITDPVGSTVLDNETIVSNGATTEAPSEETPAPNGVPSALASAGVAVASTVAVALGLLAL